jgi:hypothetical protein
VLRHKGKLIDTREKGKPNLYALKPSAIEEMKNIGTQSAWYSGIFGTKQLTGGPYAKSSAALLAVSNGRTEAGSKAGAGCYKRTEGKGKDAVVYVVMSAAYAAANGYILPAKN